MNVELDAFDLAILAILQRDNLRPQREVAEQVNLSPAAVQRRQHCLAQPGGRRPAAHHLYRGATGQ